MQNDKIGSFPIPTKPLERACLTCRFLNIKCDGVRPICGPCEKHPKEDPCEHADCPVGPRARMLKETAAKLEARTDQAGSPVHTSSHNLSMDFTVIPTNLTNNLTTDQTQHEVHPIQAPLTSKSNLPAGLRNMLAMKRQVEDTKAYLGMHGSTIMGFGGAQFIVENRGEETLNVNQTGLSFYTETGNITSNFGGKNVRYQATNAQILAGGSFKTEVIAKVHGELMLKDVTSISGGETHVKRRGRSLTVVYDNVNHSCVAGKSSFSQHADHLYFSVNGVIVDSD